MPTLPKNSRAKSYLFLIINLLCWGAAFPIAKPALSIVTPFHFLFYRFLLASILSIPILLYYWPKIKNKGFTLVMITFLEVIGTTVTLGLLYEGLKRTSALEASLLTTTTPIFTSIAGLILLKEKEEKHELLGLLIAFAGTMFLALFPYLNGSQQNISLLGNFLILAQIITSSIYFVLAKKYFTKLPKFFVTSIGFFIGMISFFFLSLVEDQFSLQQMVQQAQLHFTSLTVMTAVSYMAIFGSIIGLTAYIKGQDGIEASEASMFWYLQPLIYIPLSVLLLHEQVHPEQIIALLVILVGVAVCEWRPRKAKSNKSTRQ